MFRLLIAAAILGGAWLYLNGQPHLRVPRASGPASLSAGPILGAAAGGTVGAAALGAAGRVGN